MSERALTWVEVDLDAIRQNVRVLRAHLGDGIHLAAVVKANAYGHGAPAVAQAALAAGAEHLAVVSVQEGVELRQAGLTAPIVILGYTPEWEAETVVENGLAPTVTRPEVVLALSQAAVTRGTRVRVHIKVDTGLHRFGAEPREALALRDLIASLPGIELEGLSTHFASADEADKTFTREQFALYQQIAHQMPEVRLRHAANSSAVLDLPETALTMVRIGIALYGLYPSLDVSRDVPLRPALSLKSRLARLHGLETGDPVSYGCTWRAQRPSRVGLVPCGYAHGLRRALSNTGMMLVRGRRVPIRGRICMDQCVVDVTDVPEAELHDEVVIIGRQRDGEITADEVATQVGTISYEILTGIPPRVPRVYLQDGAQMEPPGI
ncbi:MAG: alanine racemase [Chloroflexota bacterium]|nr:MAG: alanine racemase [Chloroflexota bacterium]